MSSSKQLIVLGSEGALGSGVIEKATDKGLWPVVAVDHHETPKNGVPGVTYRSADFENPNTIRQLTAKLLERPVSQTVLVSTIGSFGHNYAEQDLGFEDIARTIQINLLGITQLVFEMGSACVKSGNQLRVVIVGSTAGYVGSRDIGYGIAKAGLNGLVLSVSKCFASKNVTAIGVNPGIFESPMSTSVSKERQKSVVEQTHLKRPGTISEIVNTVTYAAFDAPDFMTGSLLSVNGGQYS